MYVYVSVCVCLPSSVSLCLRVCVLVLGGSVSECVTEIVVLVVLEVGEEGI